MSGKTDESYLKLIEHFREWIFGMPDSEELLPLLKFRISPEEAELMSKLPFLPTAPEQISERLGIPIKKLTEQLDTLSEKGLVFRDAGSTSTRYRMVDSSFINRTWGWPGKGGPEDRKQAPRRNDYYRKAFLADYLGHPTIGLRAVPINKTVEDPKSIIPYEDILNLIDNMSFFTKTACPCKYSHNMDERIDDCEKDLHVCLHFDNLGKYIVENNLGVEITKEEALEILKKSADQGLVHGVSNIKKSIDTICNCCKCCCVYLDKMAQMPGAPRGITPSDYIREIDEEKCNGCGTCARMCPMDAIEVEDKVISFAPEKCIGCGVCAHKCPQKALIMVRKEGEKQDYPANPPELVNRLLTERGHDPMKTFTKNNWR